MRQSSALILILLPTAALPQQMPTLSGSTPLTLSLPYLEYTAAGTKSGFAANLKTSNLSSFALDVASVRTQTVFDNAVGAPQVSATGSTFRLVIPYLEYAGGGATKAYSAVLTSSDLATFAVDASSVKELTRIAAPSNVAVTNVNAKTIGTTSFSSSARLGVSWTPPAGYTPDHYRIYASETVGNTNLSFTATGSAVTANLTGLKSATTYGVTVKACKDSSCSQAGTASAVYGQTSEEVWQLQGTGNSISGLTKIVSDGNSRVSAARFGSDSATTTANRVQLYYGPLMTSKQDPSSLVVAHTVSAVDAAVPTSYLSFTSLASSSGIASVTSLEIGTGQGVPLSSSLGSKVRIFFEARGSDGKSRIYWIDSVDGWVGRDFNTGSATKCSTSADYQSGGGCPLTQAFGLESDSENRSPKIHNANQHKVGYPTLTDWRWDGSAGTFMVFTIGPITGCSAYANHGYAVWDGSRWVVQYESSGCPKLFKSTQAALPMHIGGVKYKMYFGDPEITTGKPATSTMPFLGPKKLIYADGARTGNASYVEFEDWEDLANARNVIFLWPNGDQLDAAAEGFIDDFHFLTPTGDLSLQVVYMAITSGNDVPIAAGAILLNP